MYGRAGTMIDGNIFIGKKSHAFRRDLAAQLLVHNPEVTDANEAFALAQEVIMLSVAWENSVDSMELDDSEEDPAPPCAK
jgi:hypothetical protein